MNDQAPENLIRLALAKLTDDELFQLTASVLGTHGNALSLLIEVFKSANAEQVRAWLYNFVKDRVSGGVPWKKAIANIANKWPDAAGRAALERRMLN